MKIEEYRKFNNEIKSFPYFWLSQVMNHDKINKTFEVISFYTPCEINMPIKTNLVFNWSDLSEFHEIDLNIKASKYRGKIVYQTILGHSCELQISYENWHSIFASADNNDKPQITLGICNMENWDRIRTHLTKLRLERIDEN